MKLTDTPAGGAKVWHSYADTYPSLEGDDYETFKADILAHGVRETVKFRIVDGTRQYLDGRNRVRACQEQGIDCPEEEVEVEDAHVEAFIDSLNLHRRHLTKEQRHARVQVLRDRGYSTRLIAEMLDVDPNTVRNDITDIEDSRLNSGGENSPPENGHPSVNSQNSVIGKDSKRYPVKAKRNKMAASRTKKNAPSGEIEDSLTDSIGESVPPGLTSIFTKAREFKEKINQLNALNRWIEETKKHPAGAYLIPQAINLRDLKDAIEFGSPYAVCPMCKGVAKTRKANCCCRQKGWLLKTSYANLPPEYRQ
jgi:hypothetical protein